MSLHTELQEQKVDVRRNSKTVLHRLEVNCWQPAGKGAVTGVVEHDCHGDSQLLSNGLEARFSGRKLGSELDSPLSSLLKDFSKWAEQSHNW